jgi:hypothetical protein
MTAVFQNITFSNNCYNTQWNRIQLRAQSGGVLLALAGHCLVVLRTGSDQVTRDPPRRTYLDFSEISDSSFSFSFTMLE